MRSDWQGGSASELRKWDTAELERLILTGFMGSGKTSVGRLLGRSLGWTFLDVDEEIERVHGAPAHALFKSFGESHFRRLESSVMRECLTQRKAVVALGGAAVDLPGNRNLLRESAGSLVIHLDGELETLLHRCRIQAVSGGGTFRPLLADKEQATLRFATRRRWNLRLAHRRVDVSLRPCDEIAGLILDRLPPPSR